VRLQIQVYGVVLQNRHTVPRNHSKRHRAMQGRGIITAQERKGVPLTTNIVLLTPSDAPFASATVKLYLRSWGDWPAMEPTTKLFEVCGVRSGSAEVDGEVCESLLVVLLWWCLSPRPNPRPSASVRTSVVVVAAMRIHGRRLRDTLRGTSCTMTHKSEWTDDSWLCV
jgi:hypothetical protein